MFKFWIVPLAGLLAVTVCATSDAQPRDDRPNIILIMADDLGYECLSAYGSASYKTPELDRLAASGMKFTNCFSQPLCTPSRVKMMTGRYNFRNYREFGVLPASEITFGHLMQEAGYATAIAGKWQLLGFDTAQAKAAGLGTRPEAAGFDDYCLWQVTKRKKEGERYATPLIHRKNTGLESVEDGYGPDVFSEFITDFMEKNREEPFFVYYPMVLTHDPFVPTPDSAGWDGNRYARSNEYFADMVAYMDKVVGQIVRKVDELGLRENTLIMFTGDNGTDRDIESRMTDGRVIAGLKGQMTDAGTRVPFIASWPGVVPAGRVNGALIDFSDFLPTVVSLGQGELPGDRVVDGRSFLPQLRGDTVTHRDWIFCHYDPRWGGREAGRFVRDERWKLYEDGRFYDVERDPREEAPLEQDALSYDAAAIKASLKIVMDTMK